MENKVEELADKKLLALAEYLEIDPDLIIVQDDIIFEYENIEYKILNKEELDAEIEDLIEDEIYSTEKAINRISLTDLNEEYAYNMYLSVDEVLISDRIENNYQDYVGTGEVFEYGGFYIFPL